MDAFESPYWNLVQVLAWVYLGDRGLVRRAADEVTDHGEFLQRARMPDGREDLVATPAGRPTPLTLELTASYMGGRAYDGLDQVYQEVLASLQNGALTCIGSKNGQGDPKTIPTVHWAGLRFYEDPLRAGPIDSTRDGATWWADLKFRRSEILAIWPDPFAAPTTLPTPEETEGIDGAPLADVAEAGLTKAARQKGGRQPKYNQALQEAVGRFRDKIEPGGERLTLSKLKDWIRQNASPNEQYSFEPPIPNCDDLYIDGSRLIWKDRHGRERDCALRSLERYIQRSNA